MSTNEDGAFHEGPLPNRGRANEGRVTVVRRTTFARRVHGSRLEVRSATELDDLTVASAAQRKRRDVDVIETTLLALVRSVGEVTSDDRMVVATVSALLRSGAVRLRGAFRDCPIECFLE